MRRYTGLLAISLAVAATPDINELKRMLARFAPTPLQVDTSKLEDGDEKSLTKLIEAARLIDHLFLKQVWTGNLDLYTKLRKDTTPLGKLPT